ncbi:hypothetical protein CBR_g27765 [Chara braunii]|uniref:Uncharacterized protein n=1 Tax=Chara braunii TaxID=69332 RepID=A0A388L898_CHABU|nr:hypothetical protein CBR_g27765 [Chara braunii]|eukprot:GBG78540.1 hypothetical protein CBR_g27765 [Chara braunii]
MADEEQTWESEDWDADGPKIANLRSAKAEGGEGEEARDDEQPRPPQKEGTSTSAGSAADPRVQRMSRKQRMKQMLKKADQKTLESGHEDKIEVLRDLMGQTEEHDDERKDVKERSNEWLHRHCQESLFEREPKAK